MSSDADRGLVLASIEETGNAKRLAAFDELRDPDFIDHGDPTGVPRTTDGTKQLVAIYCALSQTSA
jgi:hypothetical protein